MGVKRGQAVGRQVRRVRHQDFFRDQREVKDRRTPRFRPEPPEEGKAREGHKLSMCQELTSGHIEIPINYPREDVKEFEKKVLNRWLFNKHLQRTLSPAFRPCANLGQQGA